MDEHLEVDKIWTALKPFGFYQMSLLIYLSFSIFQVTVVILNYVLIGHVPEHWCSELKRPLSHYGIDADLNRSNINIEYEQCQVHLFQNLTNGTRDAELTLSCPDGYTYESFKEVSIISQWNLVCDRQGIGELSQLLVMLGQIVGATVFTALADKRGRRSVFIWTYTFLFIASLGAAFVPSFAVFAVLRFILGALQQGMDLCLCIISLEMFPQQYRGRITVIQNFCWTFFVVLLSLIGYLMRSHSWRYFQIATSLVSAGSLASFWVVDESLRWLVVNGQREEATALVKKIAKRNHVDMSKCIALLSELMSEKQNDYTIENDIQLNENINEENFSNSKELSTQNTGFLKSSHESAKRDSFLDIVRHRLILRYSLVLWFAWFTNSLTYYGLYMISFTLTGNRFLDFFLNGLAELPGAISYMLCIDRIGRKKSCILFHAVAGVALVVSTLLFTFKGENQSIHIVSVVLNYVGKTAIAASFALLFLYTPEIYPTNLRNLGFGLASCGARIAGMIAPYSNYFATYVPWGPGVIFGVSCIIVVFLTLFLPETMGRELPQTSNDILKWKEKDNTPTSPRSGKHVENH